jgi:L-asparaginase
MGIPGKPRVAVFTLGGTIAMQAAPGEGAAPALSASDLLAAVPGLGEAGVELRVQDVANKPGASLSFGDLFGLAEAIGAAVRGGVAEGQVDIPVRLRDRSPHVNPVPRREVRVGLATIALGDDGVLIDALAGHVDGLVVAAFGAGHVPARTVTSLARLAARMPVVLSSRTGSGPVHHRTYGFPGSETDLLARGLISAGYLAPLKARLLLHLLVATAADSTQIRQTFAAEVGAT